MGSPVCDHEGTPLPREFPFVHGWTVEDGFKFANPMKNTGFCPECNSGPDTPRNLAYHLLHTHRLTVEQARSVLTGGPMPALDQDGGVEMGVDEDDSPV